MRRFFRLSGDNLPGTLVENRFLKPYHRFASNLFGLEWHTRFGSSRKNWHQGADILDGVRFETMRFCTDHAVAV